MLADQVDAPGCPDHPDLAASGLHGGRSGDEGRDEGIGLELCRRQHEGSVAPWHHRDMGITAGPAFGRFETVALEDRYVRIVVCPELGGRVLSMVDRATDREWLLQGDPPAGIEAWSAEDAVFGGPQAYGWDECLPTVAACADPLDPTAPPLRDHGDQWGRPAGVRSDGDVLVTEWDGRRRPYGFHRRLRLEDGDVVAEYTLAHRGGPPMPYLWSMHPLLRLEVGSKIWAEWPEDGPIAWHVRAIDAYVADKSFVRLQDPGHAEVRAAPNGEVLQLSWDQAFAPWFGLWQDYGGWPPDDPRHQVAVEPTTSPHDVLTDAIKADRARMLSPGEVHRWWVRFGVYGGPL